MFVYVFWIFLCACVCRNVCMLTWVCNYWWFWKSVIERERMIMQDALDLICLHCCLYISVEFLDISI